MKKLLSAGIALLLLSPTAFADTPHHAGSLAKSGLVTPVVEMQRNYAINAFDCDVPHEFQADFEAAILRSKDSLSGFIPVDVTCALVRFEGGSDFHVVLDMTVLNAETGDVLETTRRIEATQSADTILLADFLTHVLRAELSSTGTL